MLFSINNTEPQIKSDHAFIAPSAELIGDVSIAEGVSIWFQTVIRADNDKVVIGSNSNIQDGSIIHVDAGHPVVIGQNVTVGHKVMLHGCTIGDNSLIGMGAIILNGAEIGKNCIIGAGALITENKKIPDNSMVVGSPGKVIRQIDEQTETLLLQSAQHYVDKIQQYKGLRQVQ